MWSNLRPRKQQNVERWPRLRAGPLNKDSDQFERVDGVVITLLKCICTVLQRCQFVKLHPTRIEIPVYELLACFNQRRRAAALRSDRRRLNAVPPVVDHGHDVGEVQTFYHHLHEVLVAAGAGHKLLQGKLACRGGKVAF